MLKSSCLLLLFFLACNQAWAIDLTFSKGISLESKNRFSLLLSDVLKLLPSELEKAKATISIENMGDDFNLDICAKDNQNIYGKAKSILGINKIIINEKLVQAAFTNNISYACGHRSVLKLLKATVIHELIHLYDYQYKISSQKQFKALVNIKGRKVLNQSIEGSADTYEYKNKKESFAVNFEYFILDKNFQCLKPAMHEFYSHYFKSPFKDTDCSEYQSVLITENTAQFNLTRTRKIDFSKLYQVHYLFAGKGTGIVSRWGHSMYRLVMCAPHRESVSKECINDISHHLVLSYRAQVSDASINYINGMFGKYPSQLFVYELSDIIQEYTRDELRDLWSLPLKLSQVELKKFYQITLERYWNYKGKYYFFTNHCATESVRHLRASVSDSRSTIRSLTPRKMYKQLLDPKRGYNLEENFSIQERSELIKSGLLFASKKEEIISSLNDVLEYISIPSKLKSLSLKMPSQRLEIYKKEVKKLDELPKNKKFAVFVKLKRIEDYLKKKFEKYVEDKVVSYISMSKEIQEELKRKAESDKYFLADRWKIVSKAQYGIPKLSEIKDGVKEMSKASKETNLSIIQLIKDKSFLNHIKEEERALKEISRLIKKSIYSYYAQ